jgi:putative aldouronate transport system permease protein
MARHRDPGSPATPHQLPLATARRGGGRLQRFVPFYIMFLPIAVYFLLFSYWPLIRGVIMSFQANRLMRPRPFVGLTNYADVLADPDFLGAVVNSLIIGAADMALYFGLSLLLALGINEVRIKAVRSTVQTIAYLPYLFSWSVIAGVWILVFDDQGMVNVLLRVLGAKQVFFLAVPALARPLIIGMGVWRSIGYFALLYTVAIVGIDPALYESAEIDGAGRMRQIRSITIPSLADTMKVIAVLLAMGVLTHFDEMYVMQNAANKEHIRTLLLYVFEKGIVQFKTGLATAGAVLVMIGSLAFVAATRKVIRYDRI